MRRLFVLLFTFALAFSLAMPVVAQETGSQEAAPKAEKKMKKMKKVKKAKAEKKVKKAKKAKKAAEEPPTQ